jgi:ATP-dependent Lon protease
LDDKLIISKSHILPEVYKKMGLEDVIDIDNEVLKFIIEEYTLEPGVRKLKEVLFEIIGEINLEILKNDFFEKNKEKSLSLPFKVTIDDIKTKYLKDRSSMKHKKINGENKIGHINGMWANAVGQGGIIPIQTKFFPANKFLDLKLTGMQGDVMKESMNVALTLAWDLTSKERKDQIKSEHFEMCSGVHIHCPEGAVPKDGPSAGAAITSVIYSLFNKKKIKNNFAITGEITLDGQITEIGGLDLKFLGGIKAGVTNFIYPSENQKEYESFMEKYKNNDNISGVEFYPAKKIEQVFELIFDE